MADQTAVNPATGQRIILRNGQWVPADQAPSTPQPSGNRYVAPIQGRVDPFKASADQRANEQAARQAAEEERKRTEFENKQRQLQSTGGVDASVEQGKAGAFALRAKESNEAYNAANLDPDSMIGATGNLLVPRITSQFSTDERNAQRSREREFIAAVLRYDSGAAIPQSEYESAYQTYFPNPDAGPEEVKTKEIARRRAIEGLLIGAGPVASRIGDSSEIERSARVGNDFQGASGIAPPGSTTQQITIKPEMQAEFNAWLDQHGRGFDPQDYAAFRAFLDRKYGFPVDGDKFNSYLEEGKKVSDPSTNFNRTIPGPEVSLSDAGQAANNLIQTPGGTAAANYFNQAGLGVPQLLAGQQGFDAMSALSERNPKSAIAGGLVGGITGAKGLGAGSAVAARELGLGAEAARALQNPVTQNALAGGAVGFNTAPEGQGATNALLGAGLAAGITKGLPVAGNALASSRPGQAVGRFLESRAASRAPSPDAAEVIAAGQAEGVPVTRPMVDPSVQNRVTGTEATVVGGPIVRSALGKTSSAIEQRVANLGQGGTSMVPEVAGERVRQGATDFISKSGKLASRAYRAAESRAGDVRIMPQKAGEEIGQIITRLSETANTNRAEIAYLKGLEQDIGKGLSVGALRDLRTTLRQKIGKGELTFGQNEARVLGIMDAISSDLETGLQEAGKGDAARLFAQADKAYRDRMDFISGTIQKIIGKRGQNLSSEQVFKNFKAMTTPGGDAKGFARFMDQLDPDERTDIAATFAEGLGRNNKGDFSTAQFASQVQKLPESARRTIFGQEGADSIDNLLKLSKAHDRVFSKLNHSRSGVAATSARDYRSWLSAVMGLATGVGTGNTMTGLAVAGGAGGAAALKDAVSARLLMTRSVSKWLASAPATTSPKAIDAHFRRLTDIAAREPAISGEIQTLQQRLVEAAKGLSGPTPANDVKDSRRVEE